MAVDMFLKIDGVEGESRDLQHKGEIDVLSWSWGETNAATSAGGGGMGAGKVQMQDFHFVAKTSKASPVLMLSCASGKHINGAVLTMRKAGGDVASQQQLEFLKFTLADVLVSSYQVAEAGGETIPVDQISLNFTKIKFDYTPQDPTTGAPGDTVSASWDLKRNAAA